MAVVYRPEIVPAFYVDFEEFLFDMSHRSNVYITGDLNVHFGNCTKLDTVRVNDLLNCFESVQLVNFPTHIAGHTLDCIICNSNACPPSNIAMFDPGISDHYGVTFTLPYVKPTQPSTFYVTRKFNNVNTDLLRYDLALLADFQFTLPVSSSIHQFMNTFTKIVDVHAPLVLVTKKQNNNRNPSPWFNNNLRLAKQHKRRLERKWLNSGSLDDHAAYHNHCRIYNTAVAEAKKHYLSDIVQNSPDSKSLFRKTSKLMGLSQNLNNLVPTAQLADELAHFFESKVTTILTGLNDRLADSPFDPHCYDATVTLAQFASFRPVSEHKVHHLISISSSAYCPHLDPLCPSLIKQFSGIFVPILTRLINASLVNGDFPDCYKTSYIIPKLK